MGTDVGRSEQQRCLMVSGSFGVFMVSSALYVLACVPFGTGLTLGSLYLIWKALVCVRAEVSGP